MGTKNSLVDLQTIRSFCYSAECGKQISLLGMSISLIFFQDQNNLFFVIENRASKVMLSWIYYIAASSIT